MIRVDVIPEADLVVFHGDISISASSRILRKLARRECHGPRVGYFAGHGTDFTVFPEADDLEVFKMLYVAREEVRKEIAIEEQWARHEELDKKFAALVLEEKEKLLNA